MGSMFSSSSSSVKQEQAKSIKCRQGVHDAYVTYAKSEKAAADMAAAKAAVDAACGGKLHHAWNTPETHTKGWMPPALMYDMGDKLEELGYTRPPRTKSVLSSSRKKGGAKRHGRHHRTRRRMRRHGMPEHTDKRE